MSTTGKLTLSGDLYEGNFKEWKSRTEACLQMRNLELYISADAEQFRTLDRAQDGKAASHICSRVSEAVLARVPSNIRSNSRKLIKALKKLATPFRLFDLPAEIRNIVYLAVFAGCCIHTIYDNDSPPHEPPDRSELPSMLHANAQIRREALSLFYASTSFNASPYIIGVGNITMLLQERSMLQRWADTLLMENAKNLRHVRFYLHVVTKVDIRFSVKDGLTCEFDEDTGFISPDGEILLEEHAASVECMRKALGLKGESTVMAMLANWNMWDALADGITEMEELDEFEEFEDDED